MNEHGYKYQLRPLLVPGLVFLILYPLIVGGVYYLTRFSALELKLLSGIYGLAAMGILAGWTYAAGKSVRIEQDRIILKSFFGQKVIEPHEIRKIVLFWTPQKKEVAQIVTRKDAYYVSDLYFAFPELMANIERFVKTHSIRSNFAGHGE